MANDTDMTLLRLGQQIAAALGEGWSCESGPEEWSERVAYVNHTDGHGLHLARNWRDKTRLVITGTYPRTRDGRTMDKPYNTSWPEITVAITRPAAAIAKEIERRFMPDYLKLWTEMSERARQNDEYEDGKELAKLRIMAAVPLDFGTRHNKDTADFRFKNGGDFYGDVQVSGPNSVTIKINSMDLARALEILRVLIGPRDIAAEIAGVDALIAKHLAEIEDPDHTRHSLSGEFRERFDRSNERHLNALKERRAELERLQERVKGLEVTE